MGKIFTLSISGIESPLFSKEHTTFGSFLKQVLKIHPYLDAGIDRACRGPAGHDAKLYIIIHKYLALGQDYIILSQIRLELKILNFSGKISKYSLPCGNHFLGTCTLTSNHNPYVYHMSCELNCIEVI